MGAGSDTVICGQAKDASQAKDTGAQEGHACPSLTQNDSNDDLN